MSGEHRSVGLVTQWFAPEPITVPVWIARALKGVGWNVRVLTGNPNFPEGRMQAGYRAWHNRWDRVEGFEVRRTPLIPAHSGSTVGRIANYSSWAGSAATLGCRSLSDMDVSLVYSSPATAAIPAMAAKRRYGIPFVLSIQDMWPDSVFASGFMVHGKARDAAEKVLGRLTTAAYQQAHSIAVTSPGMVDMLTQRGVAEEKIVVVYDWVDESVFQPTDRNHALRQELGLQESDFLLMYAGNHGAAQDLGTVLDAFARLSDSPRVHLAMIGDGIEKHALEVLALERGLRRVHFLPSRPVERMATAVAAADAHVVSLADRRLFEITMPSKIQSLMAVGMPLLVSARGDAARVVTEAGAGIAVPPASPQELAGGMRHLANLPRHRLNQMADSGRRAYGNLMSEKVGAARLSDMLERARRDRRSRP